LETASVHLPSNSFSLITLFHVIEHVPDPSIILTIIHQLLEVNGLIAIETPNIDSIDAKIFKKEYWGGYHIPRHWNLFSTKTLANLIENHGFKIVAEKYQTGHSFWLLSLHHFFTYRCRMPIIGNIFDPMSSKFFLIFFTATDKLRALLGFKTSSILIVAKKI
jgi:Methyltransferase domain